MRQAPGLLPYAALAVFIVGATVVALVVTTLSTPIAPASSPVPSTAPTAAAARTAGTDLSPNGRLAYWRAEPNGDFVLWLANADNSRRRSVAKADPPQQVGRTKWAVDGSAVAYVEAGVRLVVVRLDAAVTTYTLPADVRADGFRIVDHRFSPSGAHIAATVQRATSSQSDVYVSGPAGSWTRITTTEDVIAADWLNDDELLVQTTGGIVGRLKASGKDQLRPLTAMAAATPIIGDDGRIYFLSGRVSPFAGATETLVFAASASVWSATADGEDLRRESVTLDFDSYRLDGQWPGGFLFHRGTNPAQIGFAKSGAIDVPASAGLIERLAAAPDHRTAIGFAGANLVRVDLTPAGAAAAATVLLGSVAQGDVWFPRTASLAHVAPAKSEVPAARYVFSLGGHLWTMGPDGVATILRAGNTNANTLRRFTIPTPQWNAAGDRLLTVESLGTGGSAFQLTPAVISRDGAVRRYTAQSSVGPTATWSPDGDRFAVVAYVGPMTDPSVLTSNLSISLIDVATGNVTATLPGREAYWTRAGIVTITNGTFRNGDRARDGQAVAVAPSEGPAREITTIAKILADPRAQVATDVRGITQTSGLSAAPDGAYVAVHLVFLGGGATQVRPDVFAIVRASDGTPTAVIVGGAVADEAWSPSARLVGVTTQAVASGVATQRAVVRDPETGDVVLQQDGRFAGWSPDGAWIYVAKNDGLYARRVAGGDAVRFSPYGVVVAATKP